MGRCLAVLETNDRETLLFVTHKRQGAMMSYYPARTAARPRGGIGLLGIVYLVAGAIVAATHHYYAHLHSLKGIGSAVLAILLWPLLFLGIDLHIQ